MQTAKVTLKGITPLLMHRFPLVQVEALEKKTPEDQAEIAAYRTPDGKLYVPGSAVQRALVGGATFSKGKGRASLQKTVGACVFVAPEYLLLTPQTYAVDSRPVVIPSTKGRVVRHRPRLDEWTISFDLTYDPNMLTEAQMRQVLDDTGNMVGLLDFRPANKGPFGRFMVVDWKA